MSEKRDVLFFLSKPSVRKILILSRQEGYCRVCGKETSLSVVYVFRKELAPIPLVIVFERRYLPSFYGILCENCNVILKSVRYSDELSTKYKQSAWTG